MTSKDYITDEMRQEWKRRGWGNMQVKDSGCVTKLDGVPVQPQSTKKRETPAEARSRQVRFLAQRAERLASRMPR